MQNPLNPLTTAQSSASRTRNPLRLPEEHLSLMSQQRQTVLREQRQRNVSAASDASAVSMESSVSDFLEKKVHVLTSSADYCRDYHHGLAEARANKHLSRENYEKATRDIDEHYLPILRQLRELKRSRRVLEQDMEDAYETNPEERKRANISREPDVAFLERAYSSTMATRVMGASAKQKKRNFHQLAFRKDVVDYLGADKDPMGAGRLYCHLTGWKSNAHVKAAHLVANTLREDELAFLFGEGEGILTNPKNGITLHGKIEEGLDNGVIVIVPVPRTIEDGDTTRWKCVLVDESVRKHMAFSTDDGTIWKWSDLDGKELEFLTPNRPARRYLYFRFIITYIFAKSQNNTAWTEKVESKKVMWASPGPYLEKSMLCSLARNISGVELPPPLYEDTTFKSDQPAGSPEDLLLASSLREATLLSAAGVQQDEEETNDSEEER